jgi:carbonic anhydrase
MKRFFHYKGSLTTPPCTETVLWWVYQTPIHVLEEDLMPFVRRWIENTEFSAGNGNCRAVCDLVGRKVYDITAEEY